MKRATFAGDTLPPVGHTHPMGDMDWFGVITHLTAAAGGGLIVYSRMRARGL